VTKSLQDPVNVGGKLGVISDNIREDSEEQTDVQTL